MKNKTPIQELIYWIEEIENSIFGMTGLKVEMEMLRDFKKGLVRHLPKEKQFAFDCFKAGSNMILSEYISHMKDHPDFEQFYLQYAEQHTK